MIKCHFVGEAASTGVLECSAVSAPAEVWALQSQGLHRSPGELQGPKIDDIGWIWPKVVSPSPLSQWFSGHRVTCCRNALCSVTPWSSVGFEPARLQQQGPNGSCQHSWLFMRAGREEERGGPRSRDQLPPADLPKLRGNGRLIAEESQGGAPRAAKSQGLFRVS